MKTFLITALAATCTFAQGALSLALTPAPATSSATDLTADMKPYLEAYDAMAAALNKVTDLLKSIQDKESADAAAPAVQQGIAQFLSIGEEAKKELGEPSPAMQKALAEVLKESAFVDASAGFITVLLELAETDMYGSEQLKAALEELENASL